jgi:hypothetical protein
MVDGEIFVFGSNRAGRHGKGAAKQAVKFGAKHGIGDRWTGGRTYGISTKDRNLKVLSLREIEVNVDRFIRDAVNNRDLTFLVTPIGCGLAGYTAKQIAPLFAEALKLPNVRLPESFLKALGVVPVKEARVSSRRLNARERELGRSENYWDMSPEDQWAEDKRLGILDWDGT